MNWAILGNLTEYREYHERRIAEAVAAEQQECLRIVVLWTTGDQLAEIAASTEEMIVEETIRAAIDAAMSAHKVENEDK